MSVKNPEYDAGVSSMYGDEHHYRNAEINTLAELIGKSGQRSTTIPALYNTFYKFIQNPSTVSVETFKRMVDTDDTVGSGVDFLTTCLAARLGRYTHKSDEISKWVNDQLNAIKGGWVNAIKEMLSATWAGFSVTEKVWANKDDVGFVPQKLVTLPPSTLLFEVDRQGEITETGILQYQRNLNPASYGGMFNFGQGLYGFSSMQGGQYGVSVRPDPLARLGDYAYPVRVSNTYQYMSVAIARSKAIHYAFDAQGKFGNPYGRSLLRRAYKHWVMKDEFLKMMATALDRKGTPLTVVYADPNITIQDSSKIDGTVNQRGRRNIGMSAQAAAKAAFENIHNDSTIILPGKKDQMFSVDMVAQDSNGDVFIAAIQNSDRGILRALLIPSLIFTNGDGTGSYALGEQHAKTFDKILDSWLAGFKHVLLDQLIREMIAYNFPQSAWKKDGFGDFGNRELSQEEKDKEAQVFATAIDKGIISTTDLDDLNQMRESLGFRALDKLPEEEEEPEDILNAIPAVETNPVLAAVEQQQSPADKIIAAIGGPPSPADQNPATNLPGDSSGDSWAKELAEQRQPERA